jgi:inward rectifier potassium channel
MSTAPPEKPERYRAPMPVLDERRRRSMITWEGIERKRFDDAYHRLLVTPWGTLGLVVIGVYLGFNLLFALLFAIQPGCVDGAEGFWDLFFFSVQTLATIGYGGMTPATPWADILVTIEALLGLVGFAMGTGLMFAKFARPTARVAFSRKAVVGERDGQRFLMFRMANARSNLIVEATLNVALMRDEVSDEGHRLRRLVDLDLTRSRSPLFAMTWTAFHPLDQDSPLYGLDEETFREEVAGIMLSITGLDGTFHQTVYAQHAYGPQDIVWGGQFVDMIRGDPETGRFTVDHNMLHEVERRPLPEG